MLAPIYGWFTEGFDTADLLEAKALKVIWEDSQYTAMIIRGPNARRDFHIDPSDEIFSMLQGDMILKYMQEGQRQEQVIREGELLLVPTLTPHSPHRPPDTWGLVVEIKRLPEQTEPCCGSATAATPCCMM